MVVSGGSDSGSVGDAVLVLIMTDVEGRPAAATTIIPSNQLKTADICWQP